MAIEEYPILCWRLENDTVMGQVLGTSLTIVETDAGRLKKTAAEHIAKALKEGEYLSPPDIDSPQLHNYAIDIQLSYREEEGVYPLAGRTRFKIAAVHGDSSELTFGQCFLPFLDEEFYYYNEEQLVALVEHFTRETLQNLTPEQAYRLIMPSEPWLESARVHVSTSQRQAKHRRARPVPEILTAVADLMPLPKKIRRQITRLPEQAWERGEEIARLSRFLLQGHGNLLLVGEQGVGKSTLWNEAIRSAVKIDTGQEAPLTVWRTTCQRLVAKARYLGEWQAICDEVVSALAEVNGVLWVTDFISLINTGGEAQEDSVAAYLQSYLRKGQLRIIAEAKPQELEVARGLLPAFVHTFERMNIAELDASAARRVLGNCAAYAAANLDIHLAEDARDLSFQLVNRYIKYEKNPGKLVNFFAECLKAERNRAVDAGAFPGRADIDREQVIEQFVKYTGLPQIVLRDDYSLTEAEIEAFFKTRLKGQEEVIRLLGHVIQTFKAGLNDPDKPIATLLFAGPTGVGKTAATKALAEFFFSAGQARHPLFSLDMSEFQHPAHVARLIGDREKPGKLVQHVRSQPFSVVLLDEIEKAHPSVFDALLTVLDEGLLTDRFGRVTDFRSSIIVMTTNLGVRIGRGPGFVQPAREDTSVTAIRKFFRPEFFNRIDSVLMFKPLDQETVRAITLRELHLLSQRDRIRQRKIHLQFTEQVVDFIADVGFSAEYGARPILRAIEKHIVGALANILLVNSPPWDLSGARRAGGTIQVDYREGEVRADFIQP